MGQLSDFQVGQAVELSDGRTAIVHYIGSTQFAAGDWVGVELEDASGKNDGSVQGQRYFTCEPGHGMFIKPAAAKALEQSTPKPKNIPPRPNGTTVKARQSMVSAGARRQSVADPAALKRQSINASSPTPRGKVPLGSKLASPSTSPIKQLGSTSSSRSTSRTTTPSNAPKPPSAGNRTSRLSMAPPSAPATKASRPSITGNTNDAVKPPSNGSAASSRGLPNRMSIQPTPKKRLSSVGGVSQTSATGRISPPETVGEGMLSPSATELGEEETTVPLTASVSNASATSAGSAAEGSNTFANSYGRSPPKRSSRVPAISTREVDDLKTKLRVMEKKRVEDREKLKTLETVQGERDRLQGIIQKLQAKYQPQQQEIAELKKQIKEEEARVLAVETEQAEHDTVIEMATLDREMAEETAEALRTELNALRQAHEEITLEVEVLREENQELGKEMSPEEKTSQGWLQMERSNERLREALLRLRDITQQQEADLRNQVAELQKDTQNLSGTKEECVGLKENLANSETIIQDLRQQLDTALGAEEMIEELTDKNMALNQQIDDLKIAVEDLESLKEINDELEMNHTETERQMQDDIDYGESVLAEQKRKSTTQEKTIQDLEYTIVRFRDLVTTMQSDLEDMRVSQEITENEANELTNRSKAMMDLNMKLQVSASKAQTKAVETELGKMEAQESAEHLAIIQRFLPETFGTEKNSILAYLRFRRIGFKATLMHGFVREKLSGPTTPGHEDDMFACCDLLDKLTWVSSMCDRFVSFVQTCSLQAFEKLATALFDLEPVERSFTAWIEGLKKDEFKEKQCANELQRSIALMTHLAEIHLDGGLEQYSRELHTRALMLESHFQSASAGISQIKSMVQQKSSAITPEREEDDESIPSFLAKADDLISQMRSAKFVSSKVTRNLEDLRLRSLTLQQTTLPVIEQTQASASDLSESSRAIGYSVCKLLNDEGRTTPFRYAEIINAISPSDTSPFSSLLTKLTSAASQAQSFCNLTSSLTQVVEFPSPPAAPPWQLLAQKLKDDAAASTLREAEFARLKVEMSDKNTALAMREKIAEDMSVKIEVLEKRVGESSSRREQVRELELVAEASRSKEKDLTTKMKSLQQDLRKLENERDALKKSSMTAPAAAVNGGTPNLADAAPSATTLAQIHHLRSQISTLESTIRHLRRQNHSQYLDSSLSFLSEPLTPPTPASRTLLQSETRDVLKEMIQLVAKPGNQMVKLNNVKKEERFKWRPVKETASWQLNRMKEDWEGWREWKDSVSRRAVRRGTAVKREASSKIPGDVLADMKITLPDMETFTKDRPQQVTIVRPDDWEEVEGMVKAVR
ncbi:MAG: hypothetical protein Q9191_000657 [Dirinaria sp. TL-2023a]